MEDLVYNWISGHELAYLQATGAVDVILLPSCDADVMMYPWVGAILLNPSVGPRPRTKPVTLGLSGCLVEPKVHVRKRHLIKIGEKGERLWDVDFSC